MDSNEGIIDTEADFDVGFQHSARQHDQHGLRRTRPGDADDHHNLHGQGDDMKEDTPLLSQRVTTLSEDTQTRKHHPHTQSSSDEYGLISMDWDGLPWWKQPSVRWDMRFLILVNLN